MYIVPAHFSRIRSGIAETLEDGEVGLETAKELREEADEKLATLRDALDVGNGDIIEIDSDELDGEITE